MGRPLSAAPHLECADSLERRGAPLLAEVELTIASGLAPASGLAHARLGRLLARHGLEELARAELEQALGLDLPADVAAEARVVLAAIAAGTTERREPAKR